MSAEQANLDQATDVTMTDAGTHTGEPAVNEAPEATPIPMDRGRDHSQTLDYYESLRRGTGRRDDFQA